MNTPLVPLTLLDIEDLICAARAYRDDNVRHPGLTVRQRWHRLTGTLAVLVQARDAELAKAREPFDPRPPTVEG